MNTKHKMAERRKAELTEIGRLIRTQDNRVTSDPQFIVQQKRRIYGVSLDYTDTYSWHNLDEDFREAEPNEVAELEEKLDRMEAIPSCWHQIGHLDIWEFVTASFTEKGCEDYITANGHNLNEPRIYAASAYRNSEFNLVRRFLAELEQ